MKETKEPTPSVIVTAYMPLTDWAWIVDAAKKRGLNRSAFLREVVAQARANEQQAQ